MFVVAKTREESRSAPPSTSAVDALQPPRGSLAVSPTPHRVLEHRAMGSWRQDVPETGTKTGDPHGEPHLLTGSNRPWQAHVLGVGAACESLADHWPRSSLGINKAHFCPTAAGAGASQPVVLLNPITGAAVSPSDRRRLVAAARSPFAARCFEV